MPTEQDEEETKLLGHINTLKLGKKTKPTMLKGSKLRENKAPKSKKKQKKPKPKKKKSLWNRNQMK